jgi:pimeloyl-ACP methyl ester carboxylesterase
MSGSLPDVGVDRAPSASSTRSHGIFDTGQGPALVLVPSLQGRWEYLRRAVNALSVSHRVITFSLCDERIWDPPCRGSVDRFVQQLGEVLDERGVARAVVCGFSFGGRVALRFAACHPDRTAALVLISTPGPGWHLKPSHRAYAQRPGLLAPLFFAGAPFRVRAEMAAAFPHWRDRLRFGIDFLRTFITAPLSPRLMAERALSIDGAEIEGDCARVSMPTLVITGEGHLDHVVPAEGTSDYTRAIEGARLETLPRSGHFGCITRPEAFTRIVHRFLETVPHAL